MLTVTSPAASYALTTIEAVKAELGLDSGEDNARLTAWISQASVTIARACNRVLASESVSETIRTRASFQALYLSRYPVTDVASIIESGEPLTVDDYEIDNDAGIVIRLRAGQECHWPAGRIVVAYTGGYALPAMAPADLARAATLLVKQFYHDAPNNPRIRREDVAGVDALEYTRPTDSGLPSEVEALIARHRRLAGA